MFVLLKNVFYINFDQISTTTFNYVFFTFEFCISNGKNYIHFFTNSMNQAQIFKHPHSYKDELKNISLYSK